MTARVVALGLALIAGCIPEPEPRQIALEATPPRFIEPRLWGETRFARCDPRFISVARCTAPPSSSSADFVRLATATASVRGLDGTEDGGAGAILELAWHGAARGSLDRAISRLEARVLTDSSDLAARNDLAAAYIVKSRSERSLHEVLLALDHLEALRRLSTSPEVLFNRALALEGLGLTFEARAAWSEYLESDGGSAWADEAYGRREGLSARLDSARLPSDQAFRDAFAAGDSLSLDALARRFPQRARELALTELVPALLQANENAASRWRGAAALGAALQDHSVSDLVESLRAAIDHSTLERSLPQGLAAFRAGTVAWNEGRFDAAIVSYTDATAAVGGDGGVLTRWAILEIGSSYYMQNVFDRADSRFNLVLATVDSMRYPAQHARALWGKGVVAARRGRLEEAWEHLARGSRTFERLGELENAAFLAAMSGQMLADLGRPGDAWPHLLGAIVTLSDLPPTNRLHSALINAARAASNEGLHHAALLIQGAGVRTAREVGTPWAVAEALLNLGGMQSRLGNLGGARTSLSEARRIASEMEPGERRERTLAGIRRWESRILSGSRPEVAAARLDSVLRFYEARDEFIGMAGTYLERAQSARRAGDPMRTLLDLERAVAVVESQHVAISDLVLSTSFGEMWQSVFDEMIDFQITGRRDPWTALAYLERSRRLFLETRAVPSVAERTENLERTSREGTALLQYALVSGRIHRWAFLDGQRHFSTLAVSGDSVASLIDSLQAMHRPRPLQADSLLRSLGALLLPVGLSEAGRRLVVVPDRALNRLPFGVLIEPRGGRRLLELWSVLVAPSFDVHFAAQRVSDGAAQGALLIGNPLVAADPDPRLVDLPGAEREVQAIADLYPGTEGLVGAAATRTAFLATLDRHPILHFGGHAFYDERHPEASYLVLSSGIDGRSDRLYTRDLFDLELDTLRLVVLSACNSQAPSAGRGAGLWGLALPFLNAGAHTVVGALWPVDDAAAEALMIRFHEEVASGAAAPEALRTAQLELLRSIDPRLAPLSAWGGFQVLGF